MRRDHGCPSCAGVLKFTLEQAKKKYLLVGLELLANCYSNNKTKHLAKCLVCHHAWHSLPKSVFKGIGCPSCAGVRVPSLEEVRLIFIKNNIELLDIVYTNSQTPLYARCIKCLYSWYISSQSVKEGHGCPNCAGNRKYTIDEIEKIYLNCGLEFLAKLYINSNSLHITRCMDCLYKWETRPNSVMQGYGCPSCSLFKNEKSAIKYIEELTEIKPEKKTIKMDCDFQKKCIVDAAFKIKEQEIFVEINGEQHYKPVNFSGNLEKSKTKFEKQVKRDGWLRNYCKENKIILIEVDLRKYQGGQIKEYLKEQLTNYGLK